MKITKKKIIVSILVLIFIAVVLVVKRLDKDVWIGNYKYRIRLTKGNAKIVDYRGHEETIIIPGKIGPFKIVYVSHDAFVNSDEVKKVIVTKENNGVYASFLCCNNLKTVVCEDGVTDLEYDFGACENLTEVTLPNGLERCECMIFKQCYSLEEIHIPSTVNEVGDYAFEDTAFEKKHEQDKYYVAGDGCLIFCNVDDEEIDVFPDGVKYDCNPKRTIKERDFFCPDSLVSTSLNIYSTATLYMGGEEIQDIKIEGRGTVVAPENSPIEKYCKENGINFRPITEEEDAIRRQKTEAAAADVVYQED